MPAHHRSKLLVKRTRRAIPNTNSGGHANWFAARHCWCAAQLSSGGPPTIYFGWCKRDEVIASGNIIGCFADSRHIRHCGA